MVEVNEVGMRHQTLSRKDDSVEYGLTVRCRGFPIRNPPASAIRGTDYEKIQRGGKPSWFFRIINKFSWKKLRGANTFGSVLVLLSLVETRTKLVLLRKRIGEGQSPGAGKTINLGEKSGSGRTPGEEDAPSSLTEAGNTWGMRESSRF